MHLPQLNFEQLRVMNGMNKYWQEISGRDEPRRSHCAKEELVNIQDCISAVDILLILGHYVTNIDGTDALWEKARRDAQTEVMKFTGRQSETDVVTNAVAFLKQHYLLIPKPVS